MALLFVVYHNVKKGHHVNKISFLDEIWDTLNSFLILVPSLLRKDNLFNVMDTKKKIHGKIFKEVF